MAHFLVIFSTLFILQDTLWVVHAKDAILTPSQTWQKYAVANDAEARSLVDPKHADKLLRGFIPGSPMLRAIEVKNEALFGRHAKVDVELGKFATFLTFINSNGKWLLTLDETPLLEKLTPSWTKHSIGDVTYHSSRPLVTEEKKKAEQFSREKLRLQKLFASPSTQLNYFVAFNENDAKLLGLATNEGSGNARHAAIKAYRKIDHYHELVHTISSSLPPEAAYLPSLIEEGLATALGDPQPSADDASALKSKTACEAVASLLKDGYVPWLDTSTFEGASAQGQRVYAVARLVMEHWIGTYGIGSVLELKKGRVLHPKDSLTQLIERFIEAPAKTNLAIQASLVARCLPFAEVKAP